jgi:STE24 endopeptidase
VGTLLTIVIVAVVLVRDELGAAPTDAASHAGSGWFVLGLTVLPMLGLALLTHAALAWLGRRIDRTGSWRAVRTADRVLALSRWGLVSWHAAAVLAWGWLDAVRAAVGNVVLLDEAIAVTPALLGLVAGWAAVFPVDRRLREATLFRALEEGSPIHPPLTRGAFVWMQVRHQVLLVLAAAAPLAAWSELTERAISRLVRDSVVVGPQGATWAERAGFWLQNPAASEGVHIGLQALGVVAVFAVMPLLLKRLWDTRALEAGELREALAGVCRSHAVSVRDVLVWQTQGSAVNGAVLGLIGRWRYVLLTDALLERLPRTQVLAVMAHEVGHVRHGHMPWLAAALLAAVGGCTVLAEVLGPGALAALGLPLPRHAAIGAVAGLAGGLLVFGWVSRRFEWQADAFAVKHLSRWGGLSTPAEVGEVALGAGVPGERPGVIGDGAVHAVADALDRVARLNHIPPSAGSFRHGSIAERIRRIHSLRGRVGDTLPIDRRVRAIKVVVALVLAGVVVLAVWDSVS